jgi:hypothetical protein
MITNEERANILLSGIRSSIRDARNHPATSRELSIAITKLQEAEMWLKIHVDQASGLK